LAYVIDVEVFIGEEPWVLLVINICSMDGKITLMGPSYPEV
jgi:hypothetical protein